MQKPLPVYVFDNKYAADTDGFTFDLAAWLGDADSLVGSPSATVTPDTATITTVAASGAAVTVWVSGGTANQAYVLDLQVSTTAGRSCHIRGSFNVEA